MKRFRSYLLDPFSTENLVVIEEPPPKLGDRYAILSQIGVGGMGRVYLAHDTQHDRRVAIKVLNPDLAGLVGPQRFLREIRIAAGLSHPNIVPVYDSGESDGRLYYVMPYIAGEICASASGAKPCCRCRR